MTKAAQLAQLKHNCMYMYIVTDAQLTVTMLQAVQLAQMTQPQGWGKERQEGGWEGEREGGREGRRGEGGSTPKQGGYILPGPVP